MPITQPKASKRRGFTLLEVLLVVAVLGLAATLVVTRLDLVVPGHRLRLAAQEISSTVSWVRSESIGRGQLLAIRYDLDAGEYWVAFPDETGVVSDKIEPERERFLLKSLPERVRFASCSLLSGERRKGGVVTVRFSYLGACEGHMIHLVDAEDSFFTVEILPLAVQVNIYDSYWEPADAWISQRFHAR